MVTQWKWVPMGTPYQDKSISGCSKRAPSCLRLIHQVDHLVSQQTPISVSRTWRNARVIFCFCFLPFLVVQQLFCAAVCIYVDLHYVITGADVFSSGDYGHFYGTDHWTVQNYRNQTCVSKTVSSLCWARIKGREDMLNKFTHKHRILTPEQWPWT